MAHFADLGKHCSRPDCNQQDFLPITCDLCSKVHCRDHAAYEAHDCPHMARLDKRVMICPLCDVALRINPDEACELTWEKHAATPECARAAAKKLQDAEAGKAPAPKLKRCPAKGCKEKLTTINSYTCGTCKQTVCMKHRFEDTHQCKEVVSAALAAKKTPGPVGSLAAGLFGGSRVSCACARSVTGEAAARSAEARRRGVNVASYMRHFLGNTSPLGKAR